MKAIVIANPDRISRDLWINLSKMQRDLEAVINNEISVTDPILRSYAADESVSCLIAAALTAIGAIDANEGFIGARVDCVNHKFQVVSSPTACSDEINAFLHSPRPANVVILAVVSELVEIKSTIPHRHQPDGTLHDDWKAFTECADRMGIGVAEDEWRPYWEMFTNGMDTEKNPSFGSNFEKGRQFLPDAADVGGSLPPKI